MATKKTAAAAPGVVGRRKRVETWDALEIAKRLSCVLCVENIAYAMAKGRKTVEINHFGHIAEYEEADE